MGTDLELRPAVDRHESRPAPIELPMIALAHAEIAGPGLQVLVESLMPQPHLCVQGITPRNRPAAGARALLPVIHVVLLKGPRGTEASDARQSHGVLHLRWG